MSIARLSRSGLLVVGLGLGLFGLGSMSGCDDSPKSGGTGTAVQNPEDVKKRETMIEDMYKSNPPSKGPGGKMPSSKK